MGLGAVLTVTSAPLRTSPVKRGDWVLRRIMGTPVPPPPADAGSLPGEDVLADGLTVRARLEAHRSDASCLNCHSRIDPLGFALEQYDITFCGYNCLHVTVFRSGVRCPDMSPYG